MEKLRLRGAGILVIVSFVMAKTRTGPGGSATVKPGQLMLTVPQVGDLLGLSWERVRGLMDDKRLRRVKIGRRVYIPRESVDEFLAPPVAPKEKAGRAAHAA